MVDDNLTNSSSSGAGLNKVTVLKYRSRDNPAGGEQTFYIVGTAHVSKASCEKAREVIRAVKPEVTRFMALESLEAI